MRGFRRILSQANGELLRTGQASVPQLVGPLSFASRERTPRGIFPVLPTPARVMDLTGTFGWTPYRIRGYGRVM